MRLGAVGGIIRAMATVYVALREEGVDVWRPVEAEHISESIYRLADAPLPETEDWAFLPGSTVRCELRELSEGTTVAAVLVAVSAA